MAVKEFHPIPSKRNQAAGAFICSRDSKRFLLGLRSQRVDSPGVWGQFGGGVEPGESIEEAIKRELWEEAGYDGPLFLKPLSVNATADFAYHNYVGVVPSEFEPKLNDETDEYIWTEFGKWPTPLHPGCIKLIEDLAAMLLMRETMNAAPTIFPSKIQRMLARLKERREASLAQLTTAAPSPSLVRDEAEAFAKLLKGLRLEIRMGVFQIRTTNSLKLHQLMEQFDERGYTKVAEKHMVNTELNVDVVFDWIKMASGETMYQLVFRKKK